MPSAPPRPCTHPGCGTLVRKGKCEPHRKERQRQYDRQRGSRHERGYDERWARYSKRYLRKNPLCAECERNGQTELARLVDHIIPAKKRPDLFWDDANHQGLCRACHNAKTANE